MSGTSVHEVSWGIATSLPEPPGPEANLTLQPELRSTMAGADWAGGFGSCRLVKTTSVEPSGSRSRDTVVVALVFVATASGRTLTLSGSQISGCIPVCRNVTLTDCF